MKARLYARFSTDRQSETSIDDQFRGCRELAAARGWSVASEHSDLGISGAAMGNRPGVLQLLKQATSGDVILILDLQRFVRSQDLAPLLARLKFRGVRVVTVQDGFDSESRTARMQAGMSGIMSEEYLAMTADRVHLALQSRAIEGKPTGGRAYGDAVIVREIFDRWVNGDSMKAIASDLNVRGVPSPGANWKRTTRRKDGRWLVSTLHELLHNERYAGRVIWNKSRWVKDPDSGRRLRRMRPESEWIVRSCEPIIDAETWRLAQARFRPHPCPGRAPRYLLSGLLLCSECGCKLTIIGGGKRRYGCSSFHSGGAAACSNGHTMLQTDAEAAILGPVVNDLLSPEAVAAGVRAMRESAERPPPQATETPDQVAALERLVADGVLSADVAAPAIAEARRKAAEAASAEQVAQPVPFIAPPSPAAWRRLVADMREVLTGEDIPAARNCLQELLGEVVCRPDGDRFVAELSGRRLEIATGTSRILVGSGGRI